MIHDLSGAWFGRAVASNVRNLTVGAALSRASALTLSFVKSRSWEEVAMMPRLIGIAICLAAMTLSSGPGSAEGKKKFKSAAQCHQYCFNLCKQRTAAGIIAPRCQQGCEIKFCGRHDF